MKKAEKQIPTGCQLERESTSSIEVEIPIGRHWVRAIDMGRLYSGAKAQANGWGGLMDERRASLWSGIDAALQTAITKGDVRVSETVDGAFLAPSTDAYSIGWLELQSFCDWAPAVVPDCPASAQKLASAIGLPLGIAKTLSGDEHIVAWFDATINARTWFLRPVVSPNDAALLLCLHDPEELGMTFENALRLQNEETGPSELQQLAGMFESVRAATSKQRTLLDWVDVADEKGLCYHSWIKTYIRLRGRDQVTVSTDKSSDLATSMEPAQIRQARRYQMCIDAGLKMPRDDYSAMPRGIGEVAKKEGIERQSFTQDVKAHIRRTFMG